MDSDLFAVASLRLQHHTDLDRLESRGTLRIALKKAGVDAKSFTLEELEAVLAMILPGELSQRGVGDAEAVCVAVMKSLAGEVCEPSEASATSRDEILRRLAGA
jgi:hypothetical protein